MSVDKKLSVAFKLFEEKNFTESKALYEKILENPLTIQEQIQLRYGYGYPLSELGFVEEAIENYFELEKIGREISNQEIISQAIHQRGMVYRQNKEYSKALKTFDVEKNFIQKTFPNNDLFIAANLYEIGYTNLLKNNLEEAYHHLTKSLKLAKQTNDFIMIASAQRGLGEFHSKQKQYDESIEYLKESLKNFEKVSDDIGASEIEKMIQSIIENQ